MAKYSYKVTVLGTLSDPRITSYDVETSRIQYESGESIIFFGVGNQSEIPVLIVPKNCSVVHLKETLEL